LFRSHPVISIESINKLHRDFLKKLSTELEKQKKLHPDFKSKDEVLGKLTELFEYSTGKEFTKEELKKIYSEGKDRYAECIPPGYKDLENKKKKGDRHIYGDLIIWKELISRTKKEKKPIILVTDDRKEDWWTIENGKTIRPREELIKEFFDLTGIRILIYNADNFLHFAKEKRLVPKIKEATINEVKQIRLSDENLNEYVLKNFGGTSGLSVHDYINSGVLVSDSLTNFGMPIFKNYSNLGTTGTFLKEPYSTVLSDSQLGAIVPNTGTVISSSRIPFSAKLFNTETTLKKESENNNDNTSKNKETK
ncbi:MAG: PIN-like domain-containing protein, partial [Bacteroidia bacterium]